MVNTRINRLAYSLLNLSRLSVHYDIQERKKYPFSQRGKSLEKYRNRNDIFVSFTALPKLGINPSTQYNTPIGIYSYPIDYVIDRVSLRQEGSFDVPFAYEQPYIHVFSVSSIDRSLDFNKDDNSLVYSVKHSSEVVGFAMTGEERSHMMEVLHRCSDYVERTLDQLPDEEISYYTPRDIKAKYTEWYGPWRKGLMEYSGMLEFPETFVDDLMFQFDLKRLYFLTNYSYGGGKVGFKPSPVLIKDLEKTFTSTKAVMKSTFPYETRLFELPEVKALGEEGYYKLKMESLVPSDQRVACDEAFIWNFTRHLSGFNKVKWTDLMRRLGFTGAVDHGTSTIHPGEPTQAVFFAPGSIKVLEVIYNKIPSQYTESKHFDFSKWADEPDSHVFTVYNKLKVILNEIDYNSKDHTNKKYYPHLIVDSIKEAIKLVGWMNLHAKNSVWWNGGYKDILRSKVTTVYPLVKDYDSIQKYIQKLARSLGVRL